MDDIVMDVLYKTTSFFILQYRIIFLGMYPNSVMLNLMKQLGRDRWANIWFCQFGI